MREYKSKECIVFTGNTEGGSRMDREELNELSETLRQLATEVDVNMEKGYLIAYYVYKLADIIEGGKDNDNSIWS